ncbi:hypothetical protein BD413DRAFT_579039 [Trametes elegans]|nr:hypothetical protein BD413DRAFT_579039 [Trametes elegans]
MSAGSPGGHVHAQRSITSRRRHADEDVAVVRGMRSSTPPTQSSALSQTRAREAVSTGGGDSGSLILIFANAAGTSAVCVAAHSHERVRMFAGTVRSSQPSLRLAPTPCGTNEHDAFAAANRLRRTTQWSARLGILGSSHPEREVQSLLAEGNPPVRCGINPSGRACLKEGAGRVTTRACAGMRNDHSSQCLLIFA